MCLLISRSSESIVETKTKSQDALQRGEEPMPFGISRRFLLAAGVAALAWSTGSAALAQQAAANLRFSAVFSEQDIRAEMMKRFAEDIRGQGFTLQPYYGGTLYKQGTELVAM